METRHETFFYNTPYERDCLNCINRTYLIHASKDNHLRATTRIANHAHRANARTLKASRQLYCKCLIQDFDFASLTDFKDKCFSFSVMLNIRVY